MAHDIPSISDLEAIQLLNKHYAEVVTSKKDGVASGLDITQTTNPITGVTRRTLYKILDDMDETFLERLLKMAFTRVGTFTAGATLTDMRQTLLWEVSQGGDGHEYGWTGSFLPSGKVVPAGSTPTTTGGVGAGAWVDRSDVTLRSELNIVVKVFESVADMKADASLVVGQKCRTIGYYAVGDGGGNDYEIVAAATGTDDGGAFITLSNGLQAKALFPSGINVAQFGAVSDGVDVTLNIQNAINFAADSEFGTLDFYCEEYTVSPKINYCLWIYNKEGLIINGNGATLKATSGIILNILDSKTIKIYNLNYNSAGTANAGLVIHCSSDGAGIDFNTETWNDGVFEVDDYRTDNILIENNQCLYKTTLAGFYCGFAHQGAKDQGTTAGMISNISFVRCVSNNSAYHGFSTAFTKNVIILDCKASSNEGYGVDMSNATVYGVVDGLMCDNAIFCVKIQSAYRRDGVITAPTGIVHNVGCKIKNCTLIQKVISYTTDTQFAILDTGIGSIIENNTIYSNSIYATYLRGDKTTARNNRYILTHDSSWNSYRVFAYFMAAWDTVGTSVATRIAANSINISGDMFECSKPSGGAAVLGGYKLYFDDQLSVNNCNISGLFTELCYINGGGDTSSIRNITISKNTLMSTGQLSLLRSSFSPASLISCKLIQIEGNVGKSIHSIIDSVIQINYDDIIISNNNFDMVGIGAINHLYDGGRIDRLIMSNNRLEFSSSSDVHIVRSKILAHSIISNNHLVAASASSKLVFSGYGTSPTSLNCAAVGNVHTSFSDTGFNSSLTFSAVNQVASF